jgi:hypothetical protein
VIELEQQRREGHTEKALEVINNRLWWDDGERLMREVEERFINAKRDRLSKLTSDYRRKLLKQEQISAGIASISPYACFTLFAARLAGTDLASEDKFIAATERYCNEYFRGTSVIFSPGRSREEKPVFSYSEPALGERLRSGIAPLSILLLFTALFLIGGYVIFLRGDVK